MDCAKFSKQLKYVISKIVDGPKRVSVGFKYCLRWYGYNSTADTWEPINHLQRSPVFAYCKRKKIKIPKEIDRCLAGVLSVPPSNKNN